MEAVRGEVGILAPGETRRALALLREDPCRNLWVIHNLLRFGPFNLGLPEQGSFYVFRGEETGGERLRGLLYCSNLGFWRFHARSGRVLFRLMEAALEDGSRPVSIAGDPGALEEALRLLERGSRPLLPPVLKREEEVVMRFAGGGGLNSAGGGARLAGLADLEEMIRLEKGLQVYLLGRSAPVDYLRDRIREVVERGRAAVFPAGRRLASKAELEVEIPGSSQLSGVFTRARHRRRGYASACCGLLCRMAVEEGRTVCLETQRNNHAALSLYRGLGFEIHAPSLVVRFRG